MDFFLPIIPLFIEIDGLQHSQKLDKLRDSALNDFGIKTVRISANSVRTKDKEYNSKINEIYQIAKESLALNKYKENFEKNIFLDEDYRFTITAIARFQILILELIKSGKLDLKSKSWNIKLLTDVICSFNWALIACEDLFEWMPIAELDEKFLHQK